MRQAGRYLPEYRETRARAGNFLNLCKNPEMACEVTLQPLRRFPLDAAILFSDILTIPDAMGLGLTLDEGVGPRFERPLREPAQIRNLVDPDIEGDLGYVLDAVRLIRRELDGTVPLIGFSGSPWTLATYMVGRGRQQGLCQGERTALRRPRQREVAAGKGDRRGRELSQGPGGCRRAGFDGVRYVGRGALHPELSRVLSQLHGNDKRIHSSRILPPRMFR